MTCTPAAISTPERRVRTWMTVGLALYGALNVFAGFALNEALRVQPAPGVEPGGYRCTLSCPAGTVLLGNINRDNITFGDDGAETCEIVLPPGTRVMLPEDYAEGEEAWAGWQEAANTDMQQQWTGPDPEPWPWVQPDETSSPIWRPMQGGAMTADTTLVQP